MKLICTQMCTLGLSNINTYVCIFDLTVLFSFILERKNYYTDKELIKILEDSDFYSTDEDDEFVLSKNSASDESSSNFSSDEEQPEPENLFDNDDSSGEDRPLSSFGNTSSIALSKKNNKRKVIVKTKFNKKQKLSTFNWCNVNESCDINPDFPEFESTPNRVKDREKFTPLDYFSQYFNDDFFQMVADKTNIHFHQVNNSLLNTTLEEIRSFVGITLLMSTLGYPRIRMYWSDNFKISLITNTMTRNTIFEITNFLHAVNNLEVSNTKKERDKLWKVRPIIEFFSQRCFEFTKGIKCWQR